MSLNKFNSIKKGFTVLELLVVIAIIGILAGVILASMADARAKARDAKRIEEIHSIQTALTLYYDKYGYYPFYDGSLNPSANNLNRLVAEGYLPSVPVDPLGGNSNYHYTALSMQAPSFHTSSTPTASDLVYCNSYHLAVSLEKSNSVINSDSDFISDDTNVLTNRPGYRCGSPQYATNVADGTAEGVTGGCTHNMNSNTDYDSGKYCYDIMKQN